MTHRPIGIFLVMLAALYISSCTNQTKAPVQADNTPKMADHNQHSMAMMQNMDAMMEHMSSMKMTGDFDVDFANMMVEHHQGAISMSQVELKEGSDAQMRSMAQKIIAAQQAEIAKLRDFVQNHPVTPAQQHQMAGGSMQSMHDQMKAMPMSGRVDQDFASMMKVHHQGAVKMAQEELAKGKQAGLKQMAQQMITDQQREIAEFQAWLDKNPK